MLGINIGRRPIEYGLQPKKGLVEKGGDLEMVRAKGNLPPNRVMFQCKHANHHFFSHASTCAMLGFTNNEMMMTTSEEHKKGIHRISILINGRENRR